MGEGDMRVCLKKNDVGRVWRDANWAYLRGKV